LNILPVDHSQRARKRSDTCAHHAVTPDFSTTG